MPTKSGDHPQFRDRPDCGGEHGLKLGTGAFLSRLMPSVTVAGGSPVGKGPEFAPLIEISTGMPKKLLRARIQDETRRRHFVVGGPAFHSGQSAASPVHE